MLGSKKPELEGSYEKDLKVEVFYLDRGWISLGEISGMGVIPESTHYKIRVRPEGKADLLTVTSCHREWKSPDPKKEGGGWFKQGYYEFAIEVSKEHELSCPIETGVFEKSYGRHGWGLLVIRSKRDNMDATVKCNGATTEAYGASVCQSRERLLQSIHFKEPVKVVSEKGCDIEEPTDSKNFFFQLHTGECVYYFVNKNNPTKAHKLVTYGYSKFILRE